MRSLAKSFLRFSARFKSRRKALARTGTSTSVQVGKYGIDTGEAFTAARIEFGNGLAGDSVWNLPIGR